MLPVAHDPAVPPTVEGSPLSKASPPEWLALDGPVFDVEELDPLARGGEQLRGRDAADLGPERVDLEHHPRVQRVGQVLQQGAAVVATGLDLPPVLVVAEHHSVAVGDLAEDVHPFGHGAHVIE